MYITVEAGQQRLAKGPGIARFQKAQVWYWPWYHRPWYWPWYHDYDIIVPTYDIIHDIIYDLTYDIIGLCSIRSGRSATSRCSTRRACCRCPGHPRWSLDGEEPFVSDLSTQQRWYCVYGQRRAWSCRMSLLREKTLAASASSGGRSPAATASWTVLTGITTGGWSEMSRNSCSMSAASMQEGMCFNRSASISASSSISISVRGPWSAKSRSSSGSIDPSGSWSALLASARCAWGRSAAARNDKLVKPSWYHVWHHIWYHIYYDIIHDIRDFLLISYTISYMKSYMILDMCHLWYHIWNHKLYDIIHDIMVLKLISYVISYVIS